MKIKIVGFKVGESRPTANREFDFEANHAQPATRAFSLLMLKILERSDFVSIRKVASSIENPTSKETKA